MLITEIIYYIETLNNTHDINKVRDLLFKINSNISHKDTIKELTKRFPTLKEDVKMLYNKINNKTADLDCQENLYNYYFIECRNSNRFYIQDNEYNKLPENISEVEKNGILCMRFGDKEMNKAECKRLINELKEHK